MNKGEKVKFILSQIHESTVTADWLSWFLDCLGRAIVNAETILSKVLFKSEFWKKINQSPVNDRQRNVIKNMFEDGFVDFISTSEYVRMANDTARRDIQELVSRGVFLQNDGGGRNASYRLTDYAT